MSDSLHEFLRWGPYGVYATLVLMILAIPLGWMYAYIACVGKRRDITEPDPERRAAAWGGAFIIALSILIARQIIWGDNREFDDAFGWAKEDAVPYFSALVKPVMETWISYAYPPHPVYVRLLTYVSILFIGPFLAALPLILGVIVFIGIGLGSIAAIFTGFAFSAVALGAAFWFLPGFLMGVPIVLYFLFVRLPLQVAYRRAIREGRWPTTDELVRALAKGTLNKADWQSKIMAHKAQRFEASLDREAARVAKRR